MKVSDPQIFWNIADFEKWATPFGAARSQIPMQSMKMVEDKSLGLEEILRQMLRLKGIGLMGRMLELPMIGRQLTLLLLPLMHGRCSIFFHSILSRSLDCKAIPTCYQSETTETKP